MVDMDAGQVRKAGVVVQHFPDIALHPLLGHGRGGAIPENFQVKKLVVDLENGKEHVGVKHLIDIHHQVIHVLPPVPDDVRGNDEFFQEADFELEHVLIHRDSPQLAHQFLDRLKNAPQFRKGGALLA